MPDATVNGLPGPWSKLAICAGENPDTFFPSNGDPGTRARHICAHCPVRRDCAQYATEADEFGIWGGLDQEQRRALAVELMQQMCKASWRQHIAAGQKHIWG
jgi:hypothetical protein